MNDLSTVDGMKDCSKKDSFIVRAMPGRSFIHSFIHSFDEFLSQIGKFSSTICDARSSCYTYMDIDVP